MTTRSSRDPISDRIACWKQAYDAVLAEIQQSTIDAAQSLVNTGVKTIKADTFNEMQRAIELAARTAATLAIGATTRGRGE